MPCRSEHMVATDRERELSRIFWLLDEVQGIQPPRGVTYGDGYDPRAYSKTTQALLDQKTAELCRIIPKLNLKEQSLEMQIWWRDHQKADKERLKREKQKKKNEKDIQIALAKLTTREKKLLGLI